MWKNITFPNLIFNVTTTSDIWPPGMCLFVDAERRVQRKDTSFKGRPALCHKLKSLVNDKSKHARFLKVLFKGPHRIPIG